LPAARKAVAWHDHLTFLAFKSNGKLVAVNDGDGAVYLSHVTVKAHFPPSYTVSTCRVGNFVRQGEVVEHTFGEHPPGIWETVINANDDIWANINKDVLDLPIDREPCYLLSVFYENDPFLLLFRETSEATRNRLAETRAEADVYYYSPHLRKMLKEPLKVVGIFYRRVSPSCVPRRAPSVQGLLRKSRFKSSTVH